MKFDKPWLCTIKIITGNGNMSICTESLKKNVLENHCWRDSSTLCSSVYTNFFWKTCLCWEVHKERFVHIFGKKYLRTPINLFLTYGCHPNKSIWLSIFWKAISNTHVNIFPTCGCHLIKNYWREIRRRFPKPVGE